MVAKEDDPPFLLGFGSFSLENSLFSFPGSNLMTPENM